MAANQVSNVTDATIVAFIKEYTLARRKHEEAGGVVKQILKRAKSFGVNPSALTHGYKDAKREPDEIAAEIRDRIHYLSLRNLEIEVEAIFGFAAEPLPQKIEDDQQNFEANDNGYKAGMAGESADANPWPPGTMRHVSWSEGHIDGEAGRIMVLGEEGATADATRRKRKKEAPPKRRSGPTPRRAPPAAL